MLVKICKSDVFPGLPLSIPSVFDLPNCSELGNLFFYQTQLWVGHWFDVEDLQTKLHLLFSCSELSCVGSVLCELLEGLGCVTASCGCVRRLSGEVLSVVLALFLEVKDTAVNFLLELLVALLNDAVCLIKALLEALPLCVETVEFCFVVLAQLCQSGFLLLVILKVLELLFDWFSACT